MCPGAPRAGGGVMGLDFGIDKITMIQFVRRFPLDREIRTKPYAFEEKLRGVFREAVVVNQIPQTAPPDVPYFVFHDSKKQMIVSQNSVQLTLDFSKGFPDSETVFSITKKYSEIMDAVLDDVLSYQDVYYSGIIVYYMRPFHGEREVLFSAVHKQITGKLTTDIAGFNVLVGRQVDGVLCNVEVSEVVTLGEVQTVSREPIYLDMDFMDPKEKGLQIKLDVNTKRLKDTHCKASFSLSCGYLKTVHDDAHALLGDLMTNVGQ